MKPEVCAALGWHLDWPDGSSTMKEWFDQAGGRRGRYDVDTLLRFITELGWTTVITSNRDGSYSITSNRDGHAAIVSSGPTLLAATENLVLAVDPHRSTGPASFRPTAADVPDVSSFQPKPVIVVIEGGLVQTVCSANEPPVPVVVIDYDTEGCDPDDEVVTVPQGAGRSPVKAWVSVWPTPEPADDFIAEFALAAAKEHQDGSGAIF